MHHRSSWAWTEWVEEYCRKTLAVFFTVLKSFVAIHHPVIQNFPYGWLLGMTYGLHVHVSKCFITLMKVSSFDCKVLAGRQFELYRRDDFFLFHRNLVQEPTEHCLSAIQGASLNFLKGNACRGISVTGSRELEYMQVNVCVNVESYLWCRLSSGSTFLKANMPGTSNQEQP